MRTDYRVRFGVCISCWTVKAGLALSHYGSRCLQQDLPLPTFIMQWLMQMNERNEDITESKINDRFPMTYQTSSWKTGWIKCVCQRAIVSSDEASAYCMEQQTRGGDEVCSINQPFSSTSLSRRLTHSSLATSLLSAAHWWPESRLQTTPPCTNNSHYFKAPVESTARKSTILKGLMQLYNVFFKGLM